MAGSRDLPPPSGFCWGPEEDKRRRDRGGGGGVLLGSIEGYGVMGGSPGDDPVRRYRPAIHSSTALFVSGRRPRCRFHRTRNLFGVVLRVFRDG
ncbi:hypothetical protein B296_00058304 [Ensete ventricosum]|uniref:Uncharacterized protein n=1 Tax=Ensete ventricosum TaxID=4639 RepID=A0A426XEQ5_ENSVE|nr:hypothetical protein B296_00058304 [Ensete ventricosum]